LSLSSQNLLWLAIVLFLLVIRVCWHEQGSVPRMFWRACLLDDRDGALTIDQYTKVVLSLQTSSSVRRLDVCRRGGTNIFNDAASVLKWVETKVSLSANETVMGKTSFEQWLYDQCVCNKALS
jgi:hypothetical protein